MKVGSLVRYSYFSAHNSEIGTVTKVDGVTIWWINTEGHRAWTHVDFLEIVSESRC